jgi:hypothetical protein
MKVYVTPIPAPSVDYANFDLAKVTREESEHQQALCDWLRARGYTGKRTGQIASFPVADGYAQYMLAEGPKKTSCLIHLPYGDAYSYLHIEHLPKKVIIDSIERKAKIAALFSKQKEETQ